jgi:broad specificity phosphatase PhoE
VIDSLPPLYIARHAETVFNAAARLQGQHRHTPLSHAGIAQAHAMGTALAAHFSTRPNLQIWSSTAGRAQQTAAIVCEHLGIDFFACRLSAELQEIDIGAWEGRLYSDIVTELGAILDTQHRLFRMRPPGGEWYDDIALRMRSWLDGIAGQQQPCLVISHGISSRILRGLLVGGDQVTGFDGVIARDAPQGTILKIEQGQETILHLGTGDNGLRRVGAL